jgi:flagellar hook assembly protein FlgD
MGESQIPKAFFLSQNYPNPFNPSTSISFGLPKSSSVKLEVFNLLGQRVKVLVNGVLDAGYKTIIWDGKDETGTSVSSGVYLNKLTSKDFQKSQKMLLLK